MRKLYLISLQGSGYTEVKVVDEETWNWIMSENKGLPHNYDNSGPWKDTIIPESIKLKIWNNLDNSEKLDFKSYDEFGVYLSRGSWQNDRALIAPAIEVDNKKLLFFSLKDFVNNINKENIEILEEYEGYIY